MHCQTSFSLLSMPLSSTGSQGKLWDERKTSPSSSQTPLRPVFPSHSAPTSPFHPPTTPPDTPNIFNYIFYQVVRLSNQGADIDACADKSANTGNKINKDFEERVTANFAQWFGTLFKTDVFDRASHAWEFTLIRRGGGLKHSSISLVAFTF